MTSVATRRRGTAPGSNPRGEPSPYVSASGENILDVRFCAPAAVQLTRCSARDKLTFLRMLYAARQPCSMLAGVPLVEPPQEAGMKLQDEEVPYDNIAEQILGVNGVVCCGLLPGGMVSEALIVGSDGPQTLRKVMADRYSVSSSCV